MRSSARAGLVAVMCVGAVWACGDGGGGSGPSSDPASIQVSAESSSLFVGETTRVSAVVRNSTGDALTGHTVSWESLSSGVATVDAAGTVTAVGPGSAVVRASTGDVSGTVTIAVSAPPCTGASPGAAVSLGVAVSGSLAGTDCRLFEGDGPYGDGYTLELSESTAFELVLTSADFDAVVAVSDADAEIVHFNDDDGSGGTDSRLFVILEPGSWIVWASSFGVDETGAYELTVDEVDMSACSEPVGTLEEGDAVEDALDYSSCISELVGVTDPWRFVADGAGPVQFDMTSDDFDGVLVVVDENDDVVAVDDDSGGDFNPRLIADLPAGTYTVYAASFEGSSMGAYELSLAAAAAAPSAVVVPAWPTGPSGVAWPTKGGKQLRR